MKKILIYITVVFLSINIIFTAKAMDMSNKEFNSNEDIYNITMKQDLLCLMMAYPEYVTAVEKGSDGYVYLIMKSGGKIIYDDKRVKNAEQKLENPDLQDMLEQIYPLHCVNKIMDKNFDPGRYRVYNLLREVYGGSKQKIESNLVSVNLGYKSFQFNKEGKASEALKNVMKELVTLTKEKNNIGAYLFPCSGTFNYRLISGTNRLSPHSFGIAIDLARNKRDYWKWASKEEGEKRLASYPKEIVEVFERNNFVWGGKWQHFDILHFEYRPEIILKARYFGNKDNTKQYWYDGVPLEEHNVEDYIKKIDEVL
ncbi:M15 family metallopeptidase [Clostridium sp. DJ247]|uniref:M15 family metallopeptidase n=1 Tax=Clostridium sp. DJ247 TaxID=2726188 RepID=UPI0037C0DB36|nr:M15 family metallopeptidase [Clostridium sp. DJ247]